MKTNEEKIFAFLTSFSQEDVKKGLKLWSLSDLKEKRETVKEKFSQNGWYSIGKNKPENTEYHYIDGEYWVQDPEVHEKMIKESIKTKKEFKHNQNKNKSTEQKAMMGGIKKTEMKCPTCNHTMYKEPICPSCKEGKVGYKIRLMCENNPDHEVLL